MLILASVHWRKINAINFSHYETFTNILKIWTISNKLRSTCIVNTIVEHYSIILMQLLIISSLKSVSRYVSYREANIAIRIVSWGECIVAALSATMGIIPLHLLPFCLLSHFVYFLSLSTPISFTPADYGNMLKLNYMYILWEMKIHVFAWIYSASY